MFSFDHQRHHHHHHHHHRYHCYHHTYDVRILPVLPLSRLLEHRPLAPPQAGFCSPPCLPLAQTSCRRREYHRTEEKRDTSESAKLSFTAALSCDAAVGRLPKHRSYHRSFSNTFVVITTVVYSYLYKFRLRHTLNDNQRVRFQCEWRL